MRTTLTLDEDVAQHVKQLMRERGSGLKQTVNELIRRGLRSTHAVEPYDPPLFSSGVHPAIDLDRATALAATLDDDEIVRKVEMGK
jgi:hypothetical protein